MPKSKKKNTDLGKYMKNKKTLSSLQLAIDDQNREIKRLEQNIAYKNKRINELKNLKES